MPVRKLVFVLAMIAAGYSAPLAGQQSTETPHGDLPEGMVCEDCHSSSAWAPLRPDLAFDHQVGASFPLIGAHQDVVCVGCHSDLHFDEPETAAHDCGSCHLDVHLSSFAQPCSVCHTAESFSELPPGVVHPGDFPLEGAHLETTCESCHVDDLGGAFSPLDRDCLSCHLNDYDATVLVDHAALGYPTDCTDCHSMMDWRHVVAFEHTGVSSFELQGAHAVVACFACHSLPDGSVPAPPAGPEDCVGCHRGDYDADHGGSTFPLDCLTCHTQTEWTGVTVDHVAIGNGYPLVDSHLSVDCAGCHAGTAFSLLWTPVDQDDCSACHQADYDRDHSGSGFPLTCLTCHSQTDWTGVTADHTEIGNGYPLVERHGTLACADCHDGVAFTLFWLPTDENDCAACHQTDYDTEHGGTGYPLTCLTCHTQTDWSSAEIDHVAIGNGFLLVGNHDQLTCSACHLGVPYVTIFTPSTPDDCWACHQGDYTTEHSGSGFQRECLDCHVVTTWDGAVFDHDGLYFPIYSGDHSEEWATCSTCHTVPDDYSVFTCLDCHEHSRAEMDDEHSDEGAYSYNSAACLDCHPDGKD